MVVGAVYPSERLLLPVPTLLQPSFVLYCQFLLFFIACFVLFFITFMAYTNTCRTHECPCKVKSFDWSLGSITPLKMKSSELWWSYTKGRMNSMFDFFYSD